jgi:ferric-dicitrate binding protein FerR (iron transport regulator)
MNVLSDFLAYTSHDLAANESFQSYFFKQKQEDIDFWEKFIRAHPGKREEITEALELLAFFALKKNIVPAAEKQIVFDELIVSIAAAKNGVNPKDSGAHQFFNYRWSRLAATLSGVLIVVTSVFFFAHNYFEKDQITYHTPYGKNSTFILPDSSVVTLNGNTTLSHASKWNGQTIREVWLDGEAFFDVRHENGGGNARFVVHTQGMDVEVLGTKFNVFNREDKANVILNSGKVKVHFESDTTTVTMIPDEALEYFRKNKTVTRKQVNAERLTAWRKNILVFENTPLYKITEMIEDTYGLEIVFKGKVDSGAKLVGTIPSDNLDVLLEVLAKSSNLRITKTKDQIIIEQKGEPTIQQKN